MEYTNILILIIDDDFREDDPLVFKLKEKYKDVLIMESEAALRYIHDNLSQPMIILLDILMPHHLDGHQVLEEIRKISFLIPVIIFTAVQEEKETFGDFINNKAAAFVRKDDSFKKIIGIIDDVASDFNYRLDGVLEKWIEQQPPETREKPFLSSPSGKIYTLVELLDELRKQTDLGQGLSSNILKLAIDLLARGKKEVQ